MALTFLNFHEMGFHYIFLVGILLALFSFVYFRWFRKDESFFVKLPSGRSLTFSVDHVVTVHDLRLAVHARLRFKSSFRFTFGGKCLQDPHPLLSYGVAPGSTIFLLGRLRGGP